MPSIEEKVKQIIVEQLGVEEAEVVPAARLQEDLGADSLDIVELTMALEAAFDIEIPDEDVADIRAVQDVCDSINSHVKVGSK
ncbi:MAG: acyl carrier protein [Terriglobales bacterium]